MRVHANGIRVALVAAVVATGSMLALGAEPLKIGVVAPHRFEPFEDLNAAGVVLLLRLWFLCNLSHARYHLPETSAGRPSRRARSR